MNDSDFIAIGALLVALLSAYYARQARDATRRANDIALHGQLRPLRLAVFQSMAQFAQYCSRYLTLHHMKVVSGTRDLIAQIETFKWEIAQHGHLDMPEVESKAQEFINAAWNMQRLLDRIADGQNHSIEAVYSTARENLEALVDWFGEENRELKELFRPHLSGA